MKDMYGNELKRGDWIAHIHGDIGLYNCDSNDKHTFSRYCGKWKWDKIIMEDSKDYFLYYPTVNESDCWYHKYGVSFTDEELIFLSKFEKECDFYSFVSGYLPIYLTYVNEYTFKQYLSFVMPTQQTGLEDRVKHFLVSQETYWN